MMRLSELQKQYVSVAVATLLLLMMTSTVIAKDTVRVRSWMVSPGGAPVEEMLTMFNQSQNQIEAVHELVNWGEYLDKMLIEYAANTAPDLILVSGQWGGYALTPYNWTPRP